MASSEGHTPKGSQSSLIRLMTKIPQVLPHERVFPVQIGSELFKLSGASISSDSPSYFSQYFQCQIKEAEKNGDDIMSAIRTLYIDRDPVTFRDIALHLQGYHVEPRDGTHFVRLFADAQFYSLPKLISQLYEESIFMSIGHREFQIPRDLFTGPGNSPNFFSLGFAMFFSAPDNLFPGLDREGLIRPPSILPPSVPNRSAETFAELLHLLRGYPVEIRSDTHRQSLLRDCRYFNFKGLEQRLVPHRISFNQRRRREEIALRLEDILKSGISIAPDPAAPDPQAAWVNYARPFVDDRAYELVLEIGSEATKLYLNHVSGGAAAAAAASSSSSSDPAGGNGNNNHHNSNAGVTIQPPSTIRAEFFRDARARVAKLFEVIATKLNLPPTTQPLGLLMAAGGANSQPATPGNTPLSEDLVRVVIEPETSIVLDGREWTGHVASIIAQDGAEAGLGLGIPAGAAAGGGAAAAAHAATSAGGAGGGDWGDESSVPGLFSMPSSAGGAGNNGGQDSPMSLTVGSGGFPPARKRRRLDSYVESGGGNGGGGNNVGDEWIVRTGQWRLRIQGSKNGKAGVECVLVAVKLDALSSERARNAHRSFLSG